MILSISKVCVLLPRHVVSKHVRQMLVCSCLSFCQSFYVMLCSETYAGGCAENIAACFTAIPT